MSQIDVTRLLVRWQKGEKEALFKVWPVIQPIIEERAAFAFRDSGANREHNTLSQSVLVQESFIKLLGKEFTKTWSGRSQFFRLCQIMMTRMLIDKKRRKKWHSVALESVEDIGQIGGVSDIEERALALETAVEKLKEINEELHMIVHSLFLAQPTKSPEELANEMQVSESTVYRKRAIALEELKQQIEEIENT